VLGADSAANESVRPAGHRLDDNAPGVTGDRVDTEQNTATLRHQERLHQYRHRAGLRAVTDLIGRRQHAAERVKKGGPTLHIQHAAEPARHRGGRDIFNR
jgi:hypothetical protein